MYLVKYSIKRLLMLIPVILGVTLILYFVMALAPGNPAQQILGANASDEQLAALLRGHYAGSRAWRKVSDGFLGGSARSSGSAIKKSGSPASTPISRNIILPA